MLHSEQWANRATQCVKNGAITTTMSERCQGEIVIRFCVRLERRIGGMDGGKEAAKNTENDETRCGESHAQSFGFKHLAYETPSVGSD